MQSIEPGGRDIHITKSQSVTAGWRIFLSAPLDVNEGSPKGMMGRIVYISPFVFSEALVPLGVRGCPKE